ncbi:MAG: flagellar M-ring protein FliF [Bryobacterales bacterium]|nr:flagellar M-ring protein FliF [Bryobacterales bacterium]
MEQLKRLLATLSLRQKILIAAAAIAVIGGMVIFTNWQNERDFVVLYRDLSPEDAASVVAKLKELGGEYRLDSGGSVIRVKKAKLDDLRLQLAGAGIPKAGRMGYEIFDSGGFGRTDRVEQINYKRALEGELERTIKSLSEVETVRFHITEAKESVFTDQRLPAKASVLLGLRPRTRLSQQNVKAIAQFVASAVEGLTPEMVSILDTHGNLLTRPKVNDPGSDSAMNDSLLEYKSKVERDLLAKVNNTLEPLLGAERFRAAVSVDCDLTSSDQSEETYDPSRSVMTTSQRTEDLMGTPQASGIPGTASNLPRPTSRPSSATQAVARRTENIAYQSTRQVRRTHVPQGVVKRLSVGVLIDHAVRFEGTGAKQKRIVEPRSAENIKATKDLLAATVGLLPERGDQLIVESLPFDATLSYEPPVPPAAPGAAAPSSGMPAVPIPNFIEPLWRKNKNYVLIGAGVLFVVLLGLMFLLFRKVRGKKRRITVDVNDKLAAEITAGQTVSLPVPEADGPNLEHHLQSELAKQQRKKALQEQEILSELAASAKLPSNSTKKAEVLVKHLAEEAKRNPDGITQLVRTWLSDGEV